MKLRKVKETMPRGKPKHAPVPKTYGESLSLELLLHIFSFLYDCKTSRTDPTVDVIALVNQHNDMVSIRKAMPSWNKQILAEFAASAHFLWQPKNPFANYLHVHEEVTAGTSTEIIFGPKLKLVAYAVVPNFTSNSKIGWDFSISSKPYGDEINNDKHWRYEGDDRDHEALAIRIHPIQYNKHVHRARWRMLFDAFEDYPPPLSELGESDGAKIFFISKSSKK